MLALLEKTRLMGLYSSSLKIEFYQNGHITRYSISGCHLQYGIFFRVEPHVYNTCMSLEGGKNSTCEERCLFTQDKDHGCCFSHMF